MIGFANSILSLCQSIEDMDLTPAGNDILNALTHNTTSVKEFSRILEQACSDFGSEEDPTELKKQLRYYKKCLNIISAISKSALPKSNIF